MLQSARLEDHMETIGIDRSSFNMSNFEHRCMNNIKKMYQHAGNCDDQQNLKDIIEAALLSTPEGFKIKVLMCICHQYQLKKPSARKSMCLFTNILNFKPKTAKRRFVPAKYCE